VPKRTDIKKILIIGSGPIIIGQAAEFDYSGTQACKALKEEGYEVILVNSNPATIMTDPEIADKTYIEPLTPSIIEKILEIERPDVLLPTLGGQTGLNLTTILAENKILDKYGVELIGANLETIKKAESRELFKKSMIKIGLKVPESKVVKTIEEAKITANKIGYPVVIRPSFTLGGTGGGIAYNDSELQNIVEKGLEYSLKKQVLIEKGLLGWKEYELEVMRDLADNVVIICSIENVDPMGIHTGDSITVAPAQTLTDVEYQKLRNMSIDIMREIGVETGGSNIQFAVNPVDGEIRVIEMNPRVSRSSALASKATGFPIAKIAAKLAIGYYLDEIPNDITQETKASFEPTIDYIVVKIPRFNFDKFPEANSELTTQMKSIGEVMSIGRSFEEALQKAVRGLEIGKKGLTDYEDTMNLTHEEITKKLSRPNNERIFYIKHALLNDFSINEIAKITQIDIWFIDRINNIVEMENKLKKYTIKSLTKNVLEDAKRLGFSDYQIGQILQVNEYQIRQKRIEHNILPSYKMVDSCAAEFEAKTPYYYSCYESENEVRRSNKKKVIILGSGPNRIGQGVEFDYCCVHSAISSREEGYETIMINSNPETVSTDYDISDRLYFEPITSEDVLNIVENEKPIGIIIQFGGQTPINIANELTKKGIRILGTSASAIDLAEDRELFSELLNKENILQPENGIAYNSEDAITIANNITYPILIRPSYVLGGRAMEIIYDQQSLIKYINKAIEIFPNSPILIDKYIEEAQEVEVDAISDGKDVIIAGIMEHIEEAGVHSGDSACVLPTISLDSKIISKIREYTIKISKLLGVIGLINIQYLIKNNTVYVLEANPRASRTIPFVSKATGTPWAKIATKIILGKKLKDFNIKEKINLEHISVKEAVFPFTKLKGVDPVLTPEMKSTGEVMGIDYNFGLAYNKAEISAGNNFPLKGTAFISVKSNDKTKINEIAKQLVEMKFNIISTQGTYNTLKKSGIKVKMIKKINEGRPNIIDLLINGKVDLVINTPSGRKSKGDGYEIRRTAIRNNIPYVTTIPAALATVIGMKSIRENDITIKHLQSYHKSIK